MDLQVPLNKLKFGQDDGAGINARVAGRLDGIGELAANLFARGQIENLVVKKCEGDTYSVSNGNRRLAALRMIHGENSAQPVPCTLREVDETGAFEDSLTTAITARQLHPVDQYEAFARLDERGKTHEDIARQYGLKEKEVRQALALGRLSPKIREPWRKGEISAEVAQAFTLAIDIKQQEKVFTSLSKTGRLYAHLIRDALGVRSDGDAAELVSFVGADSYREAGGKVTEDLFGDNHSVSDIALLKRLAGERLDQKCQQLIELGWSWAKPLSDLPPDAANWPEKQLAEKALIFLAGEKVKRAELQARLEKLDADDENYDYDAVENCAEDIRLLELTIRERSFSEKQKSSLGCIVDIEDGKLVVMYGVSRPTAVNDEKREPIKAKSAAPSAVQPKSQTSISNAMGERLERQLLQATLIALQAEAPASPLAAALAAIVAAQIKPDRPNWMPTEVTGKLSVVRAEISAVVMNTAVAKCFDAKDFFGGAPKPVLLKAITEAINADESRKLNGKTKSELAKWALTNVAKTGWLPKELRTPHYAGPGSARFKKPADVKASKPAKVAAKKKR